MIKKQGDTWLVLDHTGRRVLGKHKTKEEAEKQLAAIEIHKKKRRRRLPGIV